VITARAMKGLLSALGLAGIATLALGCETTISPAYLEHKIKRELKADKVEVKSVTCPSGKKPVKGDTFECTGASKTGDKFTIKVEILDERGEVKWELEGGEKPGAKPSAAPGPT
jgi:hypothetical protein